MPIKPYNILITLLSVILLATLVSASTSNLGNISVNGWARINGSDLLYITPGAGDIYYTNLLVINSENISGDTAATAIIEAKYNGISPNADVVNLMVIPNVADNTNISTYANIVSSLQGTLGYGVEMDEYYDLYITGPSTEWSTAVTTWYGIYIDNAGVGYKNYDIYSTGISRFGWLNALNVNVSQNIYGNINASYIQNPPWLTISSFNTSNASIWSMINQLVASNVSMDGRMDLMELSNTTQAGELSALRASNVSMDGRMDAVELLSSQLNISNVSMDGRMDLMELSNTSQAGELSDLRSSNVSMDGRVDALEASNISMDGRMDNMESSNSSQALLINGLLASNSSLWSDKVAKAGDTMTGMLKIDIATADTKGLMVNSTDVDANVPIIQGIKGLSSNYYVNLLSAETTATNIFYRNVGADDTAGAAVSIINDNVSDDQNALSIQQDGSGSGIYLDQNNNTADATEGGALSISNTGNSRIGLNVYSNHAAPTTELVRFRHDNSGSAQDVLAIWNDGTGNSIFLDHNGDSIALDIDSEATTATSYGISIDTAGAASANFQTSGSDLVRLTDSTAVGSNWFFRDLAAASTAGSVVYIEQDNSGDDQNALTIQQDGTGYGLFIDQNGDADALVIDVSSASSTAGRGIEVTNAGTQNGIHLDQNGVLAAARYGIYATSSAAQTTGGALVKFSLSSGSSSIPVLLLDNDGTGSALSIDAASGIGIDMNSKNITETDCIIFASGGKICSGT